MKRWWLVLCLIIFIIGCGEKEADDSPHVIIQTEDEDIRVEVEIADEPSEWENGLMERTHLDEEEGMLFIFPEERRRSFWMKNTLIDLDIMFIDSEGVLLNTEKAVPCKEEECPLYKSIEPAKYVLEINGGLCEKYHITPGNIIKILV